MLVVHWGTTGGGPRFTTEMARALSAHAEVAVSASSLADNLDDLREVTSSLFLVRTYRTVVQVLTGMVRWPWLVWQLREACRRHDADTVVSTMDHLYQSILLPIALPRRTRLVVVVHDAVLHPGEQVLVRRVGRFLERRRADAFVTLSDQVAEQLGPRSVPVLHGRHPAWTPRGAAGPTHRRPGPPRIGLVGRLTAYKGLDVFVDAVRLLRGWGVEVEASVHGQGEAAVPLVSGAPDLKWDLRWLPAEELPAIIADLDVLVLPYQEASQSGLVAEAASLLVPCVVTPVGGLAAQALETGLGLVAKGTDASAVASALKPLLEDPAARQSLVDAGRARQAEAYTWEDLACLVLSAATAGDTSA